MIGVVEDNLDPKRKGRLKIRVEQLHGRIDDKKHIPTDKLKWADYCYKGSSFSIPSIGSVVHVYFEDDNYDYPVWKAKEHFDINLQDKLNSLSNDKYVDFESIKFNDNHQYYYDKDDGIVFDYKKTNINLKNNGDIDLNLRDNRSKLKLGSPDADQSAILGNHFMDWMDKFLNTLLTTSYMGNLMSPVIPQPQLIQIIQEFKIIRDTFLSNNVFIVDDYKVKEQTREFDLSQLGDNYNDENMNVVNNIYTKGYTPENRGKVGSVPSNVPPTEFNDNLSTSIYPLDENVDDMQRFKSPFDSNIENGKIPLSGLTISKYLQNSFDDERQYLLNDASINIDKLIDLYNKEKKSDWYDIILTKGYQDFERQENIHRNNPSKTLPAGKCPFGYANQIELYFGVDRNKQDVVYEIKQYLKTNILPEYPFKETQILNWLILNGKTYNWKLAGKTYNGDYQWWHWLYIAN